MDDNASNIETLFERVENYSKTTIEYYKLSVIDKWADGVSTFVSHLSMIIAAALSLLIVNIGLALWIGQLLDATYYGFFVIGGFYAFIAILLAVFRNQWIKLPVSDSIIKSMLKKKI